MMPRSILIAWSSVILIAAAATVPAQPPLLVSVNSTNFGSGNNFSGRPTVSADGRFVVFESVATDLVSTPDTNNSFDIFVRDLQTNTTTLVSVNTAGNAAANGSSLRAMISADGRFIAFESVATNLTTTPDANSNFDVFVRDLQTGTTTLVSRNRMNTASGNDESFRPVISFDGRVVAFLSRASDLTSTEDANAKIDVFARDLTTNTTSLISVNRTGAASANVSGQFDASQPPRIAANRYVVFASDASDLVDVPDTNNTSDVFVRDLQTGTTTLVSSDATNTATGNARSSPAGFSNDGRLVVFNSLSSNLTTNDANNFFDVFVRDLQTNTTTLVSINRAGTTSGNLTSFAQSFGSILSGDNRFVVFHSVASDLVANDANAFVDVFVRDLQSGVTTLVSTGGGTNPGSQNGDGDSYLPSISTDGRFVAFTSEANNIFFSTEYPSEGEKLLVRDLQTGTTTLASENIPAPPPNGVPLITRGGVISLDGRLAVFESNARGFFNDFNNTTDVFAFPVNRAATTGVFINDASIVEGNDGRRSIEFVVSLSVASNSTVTINYRTSADFAREGEDYEAMAGTITFAPGETVKSISVPVIGDSLRETNETFFVFLSNPSAGVAFGRNSATGTIMNDDDAPFSTVAPVLINEFRTRGPAGAEDEFVELYNNTDDFVILDQWRLSTLDRKGNRGSLIFINVFIEPRGYLLLVGDDYSLRDYANTNFGVRLEDDRGIVLTNRDGAIIDAVGFNRFTDEAASQYREGAGLPTLDLGTAEHSFVRRQTSGRPQDTSNNAADFVLVSTTGASFGNVQSIFGAPGPQGEFSPITRNFNPLRLSVLDAPSSSAPPNRRRFAGRIFTGKSATGLLTLRRTFTNTSGESISRLRFRVIDTGQTNGGQTGGVFADVRVLTSADSTVTSGGGQVTVRGLTLEQPPAQPSGGGLNSSLVVPSVNSTTPLAPGQTVTLEFSLNVVRAGRFRFAAVAETSP